MWSSTTPPTSTRAKAGDRSYQDFYYVFDNRDLPDMFEGDHARDLSGDVSRKLHLEPDEQRIFDVLALMALSIARETGAGAPELTGVLLMVAKAAVFLLVGAALGQLLLTRSSWAPLWPVCPWRARVLVSARASRKAPSI